MTVPGEDVASVQARIEAALLKEYPWRDHDGWSDDQDIREMEARGDTAWPHLSHVAEVAAQAALSGRDGTHKISSITPVVDDNGAIPIEPTGDQA